FGAVAVILSVSPAMKQLGPAAGSTPMPYYTAVPTVVTIPPDVGERGARTYARLWAMFLVPIEGADVPDDPALMPGAPRDYRAGIHEGVDFPAPSGTPVVAAAAGRVVRVDTSFLDWTREQQDIALDEALTLGYTPAATLDRIRGRQVWIDHGKGVVTRYAHLAAITAAFLRLPAHDLVGQPDPFCDRALGFPVDQRLSGVAYAVPARGGQQVSDLAVTRASANAGRCAARGARLRERPRPIRKPPVRAPRGRSRSR